MIVLTSQVGITSGKRSFFTSMTYLNISSFSRSSMLIGIAEEGPFSDASSMNTPAKLFLSWFAGNRWAFYGMGEFNPTWGQGGISSAYYQNGLGLKYQLTDNLEIEGLYTDFLAGKNQGAGRTFNIGLRLQR